MTDKKASILFPSRRQLLAALAGAGVASAVGLPIGNAIAAAGKKPPTGQIIIGVSQEPTVFNPLAVHIEADEYVLFGLFDPLFAIDEHGGFTPALVSEVPTVENGGISADGLKWRVKLRDDVKWHDGTPFTAEDVKFSLELTVDPTFLSWRTAGHELVRDLTVVSPTEITWRMDKPFAPYMSVLAATMIVPKHLLANEKDKNTAPWNYAPVGTGPFKWAERAAGDHVTLVANSDYYGDGPYVATVVYKYVPDMTVLYTQFKTGEIDFVGLQWIPPEHYEEAKSLDGKLVTVVHSPMVETFCFNMGKPQFQESVVRQALYYALDKGTIIDALYYGLPKATESYIPEQSFYFNSDLPKHEYNLDKANKLLDDAGWKLGSDGIRSKNGVKLSFSNTTATGNHTREQMQQFMQQSFKAIGVDMTIVNFPAAVAWGDYWELSKWDTVVGGLAFLTGGDPDTSPYFMSTAIAAKGGKGQNTWQYENHDVDRLLQEGGNIFVPAERKTKYLEIQKIVRDDLPFLPVFQYSVVMGQAASIGNVVFNVNVRVDTWDIGSWTKA